MLSTCTAGGRGSLAQAPSRAVRGEHARSPGGQAAGRRGTAERASPGESRQGRRTSLGVKALRMGP